MKYLPKMIRIKSRIIRNHLTKKSFIERNQGCMISRIFDTVKRGSTYKAELYRYILIAKPDHVCFHNFQENVLYKKTIILTNISIYSTKFQIQPISRPSKFIVTLQNKKLDKNFIAPGMQLKLIISFYTEDLYEREEIVTIYVQHGRPINIRLQCSRDPPMLKRIIIPRLKYAEFKRNTFCATENTTMSSNSCKSDITEYSSTIKEFNKYYSNKKSLITAVNSDMIFECGKCFVGEQVALQIKFKNIGADGKFIVISEIDWYSMCIEDITDVNILTLQYFAVWPAYFVLKSQEDVFIHTYFFPDSYGMHVDTLYIVSDNYSVKSFELIGDGIMYEPQTFQINSQSERTHLFLTKIDMKFVAHYDLHIQRNSLKEFEVVTKNISITNTSQMYMFFRWEKYSVKVNQQNEMENEIEGENDDENFADYFYIVPKSGMFLASAVLNFKIVITISSINLPHDHIYGFLQLYVEDIPQAAISKTHKFSTIESQTRRRVCTTNSVDILVADIKLIQTLYDTSIKKKSDEYIDILEDEGILEIDISQTIMKKEWSDLNIYGDRICTLMPALMLEELFSTLDIIDIKTIKSLICEPIIISHGVLRPLRLFIGIKEIFTVNIKNVTTTSVSYSWGNPVGSDCLKLQLIFCCESGCIPAGVTESIQIICCPIEEGYVESLYIPCYVNYSQKIIFLQVECEIKSFYVTFHIPYSDDILKTSDIYFEWHTSSISVRPNLLALQNLMLNKIISEKDDTINNLQKYYSESFEMIQSIYYEKTGEADYEEEEAFNQLVPFNKFISICHPVTIEFLEVPLGVATKRTFLIKNETSIKSSFWLKINNFYPVYITDKGKIKKDMMQSIYKMIISHHTEDIWDEIKQPNSGILIYVNPFITELTPYKDVFVDIYVFVDTWGIYTDELEINILGLPPYILSICVQVTKMPISFPICEKTQLKIPMCRFGILPASSQKEIRKIFIRNSSSVPLIINWQIVLTGSYSMPFNLILHMRTHFTNNLAMALRKLKDKNENEKLQRKRLEVYVDENNCQMLNDSPCIVSTDSDSNYESDIFEYEMCSNIFDCQYDSQINKSGTTEFQVDLIPNNLIDSNICTIYPDETFIPPKGKTYVEIKIFPNKCPLYKDRYQLFCNALGFIQVAPMDKYKKRHYCRHNSLLTPLMIQIEAQIVLSRLTYDIPKFDRLFTFYADDVMRSSHRTMKIKKIYVFYNKGEIPIFVKFEITDPFTIDYIHNHYKINRYVKEICIDGWTSIEVHVACSVDAMLIEEIIETKKDTSSQYRLGFSKHTNNWFNKGQLRIIYTDYSSQVLKLLLNIYLPLLRVSPCLNFEHVCIGEEKKFILDVENLSAYKCEVEIKKTKFNEDFNYNPDKGEILARPVNGKHILPITVCFSPRKIGPSIEILKIMSTVPNYEEKCVLCGEGVLNEDCQQNEAQ
ncbi:uncharacterized protein LOC122637324 [Vespula pensylvanica]|uniref:uncharacterized protein LOC122637324 n=1 Tax=Vespula pensylvanica TaxID=30213 RepID=UPI001CBA1D32|nr:uncharacterized protein LOC122637324 [Vespula pensylvanica]